MIIRDEAEAIHLYEGVGAIGLDIETGGLDRQRDCVYVVSFQAKDLPAAVIHYQNGRPSARMIEFLQHKRLITHNGTTFDIPFLAKYGYDIARGTWADTLILEGLCIVADRHGISKTLDATLKRRLGITISKDIDHTAWGAPQLTSEQVHYAAGDVVHLPALADAQYKRIHELGINDALETENGALAATAFLTVNGVPIDTGLLTSLLFDARTRAEHIGRDLFFGHRIQNPNSPQQVLAALHKMNIFVSSTAAGVLTEIATDVIRPDEVRVLAASILMYRHLAKQQVYGPTWMDAHVVDGRFYPNYWQLGTDTGRYSSSDPNIQQFPTNLRFCIRPRGEYRIVRADYSQIEVLCAAAHFHDPAFDAACASSDIHTAVAALLFNHQQAEVSPRERKIAKAATFTLLFGGGLHGMQRATIGEGIDDGELENARAVFFRRFPTIRTEIARVVGMVNAHRRADTALTVRPRHGPVRSLHGDTLTSMRVLNTIIQGTAAVGLKRALAHLVRAGLGPNLIAVIHDEILLEVGKAEAEDARAALEIAMQRGMAEVIEGNIKVDTSIRDNWGEKL